MNAGFLNENENDDETATGSQIVCETYKELSLVSFWSERPGMQDLSLT